MGCLHHALIERLNSEYGFQIKDVRGRGNQLFCNAIQGMKKVCIAKSEEEENLVFSFAAMEHLQKKGFSHFPSVQPTQKNKPFFFFQNSVYYVVDWLEGKQISYSNIHEAKKAAELLGDFHLASNGFQPPPYCRMRAGWGKWLTDWEQQAADLENFCILARQRKDSGGFDLLFLKAAELFLQEASFCIELLHKADYLSLVHKAMDEKHLCHGMWDEDYLFINGNGKLYVTDFSECRFEAKCYDLSVFLRKALKEQPDKKIAGQILLNVYSQVDFLSSQEIACVVAGVRFPYKAWRLADQYYRQKKIAPEQEWIRKLEKLIQQQKGFQSFGESVL